MNSYPEDQCSLAYQIYIFQLAVGHILSGWTLRKRNNIIASFPICFPNLRNPDSLCSKSILGSPQVFDLSLYYPT